MVECFFRVPKVGSGETDDAFRPKYADREGVDSYSIRREFPDESEYIALFEGDEEVLEGIANEDDAISLTEAEVGRIIQQDQGKGPTEGGPQPPQMGQGTTLEERVEDFIENTTGSSFVVMKGEGDFSKPLNFRRHPGFYQGHLGILDLDQMRNFSRYLVDTILRPETAVILPEHYGYWQWTAQFVHYAISEGDEFETLTSQDEGEQPDFGYHGIIHDFLNTVSIVAYPRRLAGIDNRVTQFVQEMSGLSERIDESAILRLFGPNALAVLDGLIKRRCNLNQDGNIEGSAVELVWRPENTEGTGLNYHDRLQYWRYYKARDSVQEILGTIDDLQRYNIEYLRQMGGVLGNADVLDEELSSTNHFLRIVGKGQRNYNIHGHGSAPSIAPIVLSLCCLVFWDLVDEETHQRYQDEILQKLRAH